MPICPQDFTVGAKLGSAVGPSSMRWPRTSQRHHRTTRLGVAASSPSQKTSELHEHTHEIRYMASDPETALGRTRPCSRAVLSCWRTWKIPRLCWIYVYANQSQEISKRPWTQKVEGQSLHKACFSCLTRASRESVGTCVKDIVE
jgi:hypothetical protein